MEARKYTGFLLLFLVVGLSYGQDVQLYISAPVVAEGEDVSMRCQVTGTGKVGMAYWFKRQGDTELKIAINDQADPVIERYSYGVEEAADGIIFLLNIKGVSGADNGDFGCSSPQVPKETQFVQLVVTKPVDKIRLFSLSSNDSKQEIREYQDAEVVKFEDKAMYFFKCAAAGSNPSPEMRMSIGDQNITEYFYKEDVESVVGSNPPFNAMEHTASLTTSEPIKVHAGGNAREFRCTAWVEGTEAATIHIVPSLEFAPVIDCPEFYRVATDTEDLSMQCTVRAEPACNDVEWLFFKDDHSNVTLDPYDNPTWAHFTARIEDGENPDEKVATLFIEHVFTQHFRDYTLIAKTDLGTAKFTITLERDEEADSAAGGASGLFVSFFLMLAAVSGSAIYRGL